MTIRTAERRIKAAMAVIVDHILDENSNPHESYQKKYAKLKAIDEDLIYFLESTKADDSYCRFPRLSELINLAKKIHTLSTSNVSCLSLPIKPKRWMFKTMI